MEMARLQASPILLKVVRLKRKISVFSKTLKLNAKSAPKIGRVNKP
jgi:hypothetical protein